MFEEDVQILPTGTFFMRNNQQKPNKINYGNQR